MLHEALETWFHVDGTFLRGFYDLLFRPGRMTREFNAGQRARHVPPLRFYFVLSVVFFFVFSLAPRSDALAVSPTPPDLAALRAGAETGRIDRFVSELQAQSLENPAGLRDAFVKAVPKMMLLCLPLFALYTRILNRRRNWVYLQHLIFAVHFHSFVYLLILVTSGWSQLLALGSPGVASAVRGAATVYVPLYLFLALHHCFPGSWFRNLIKTIILAWAYLFTLVAAGLATLLLAFWLI